MTFDQAVTAHQRYLQGIGSTEDARQRILNFLRWEEPHDDEFAADVQIVLVAADFSKELTATVLWLRDYKLDIRCVRLRPHSFEGEILVNVDVLIPLPEAVEYQVKVRERDEARREAAVSGERYQKYDVTAGPTVERQLNKRQAVHRLIRALSERGATPEQMSEAVPSYGTYLFCSAPGHISGEQFVEAARDECTRLGRAFDPRRFSIRDVDLIYSGDRTWAVTNQVGTNTESILENLMTRFPLEDVKWERS